MLHVQPQWQLGTEVGVDQSLISRIFNKFVDELLQRHSSKLYDNLHMESLTCVMDMKILIEISLDGNTLTHSAAQTDFVRQRLIQRVKSLRY